MCIRDRADCESDSGNMDEHDGYSYLHSSEAGGMNMRGCNDVMKRFTQMAGNRAGVQSWYKFGIRVRNKEERR